MALKSKLYESLFELDTILATVKDHFLYTEALETKVINALNQDALAHSNKLERDSSNNKTLICLNNAWKYGVDNFDEKFDNGLVLGIASEVQGKFAGYRQSSARLETIDGRIDIVTNPVKINREMGKLFSVINSSTENPYLTAAMLHLYFATIHPLEDGNGRTSRILQNLKLYRENLSPIIVPCTERLTYLRHIEEAVKSFRGRSCDYNPEDPEVFTNPSLPEVRFFEYLIDKAKESAIRLSKSISNQKKYSIDIQGRDSPKALTLRVRNAIRDTLTAYGLANISSISLDLHEGVLTIVSPATEECLIGTMEKYRSKDRKLRSYTVKKVE